MPKLAEPLKAPSSIGPYSFEEFLEVAALSHGNPAPGLILGGFMVDAGRERLPGGIPFGRRGGDRGMPARRGAVLTAPPSTGNGWMRVVQSRALCLVVLR
jgi:formylmethanofuran dehydrogenase subunit E